MVREGFAWAFTRFSVDYVDQQEEARRPTVACMRTTACRRGNGERSGGRHDPLPLIFRSSSPGLPSSENLPKAHREPRQQDGCGLDLKCDDVTVEKAHRDASVVAAGTAGAPRV